MAIGLSLGLGLGARSGTSLAAQVAALFGPSDTGWFYDNSDFSTMFQDSAGTIPVTDVGQPVGLQLDKSRGLVLGPELVNDGTFSGGSVPAGWASSEGGTGSVSNGSFNVTASGGAYTGMDYSLSSTTQQGKTYVLEATLVSGTARINFWDGVSPAGVPNTDYVGPQTFRVIYTRQNAFFFSVRLRTASNGATSVWDNISVRELPGNHRSQSISLNRPILARHPVGGRRNLLTYTEQFDNAAWFNAAGTVNVVANTATAPNGTMTADKLVPAAATSWMVKRQTITLTAISHVLSVWAKLSDVGVNLEIYCSTGARTGGAVFNLSTGAVITSANCTTSVSADDGNGWRRYAIIFTPPNGASIADIRVTEASTRDAQMTGNGSKGILVWGAQLETGSTATAYQRVGSVFDVTEAGVADRYYLSYNGTNNSLATSAFDWGTDKATVVAGVRKLSDAAIGIFVEISVNSNSNIGSFNIFAPESATPSFAAALRGNMTTSAYRMTSFAAPISNVVAVSFDISGATVAEEILPRVNAMTPSLTSIGGAAAGGGNFGTYPVFFGARGGTSLFFNGYEYSQFGINRLLTESELALVERYTNSRTGAY